MDSQGRNQAGLHSQHQAARLVLLAIASAVRLHRALVAKHIMAASGDHLPTQSQISNQLLMHHVYKLN